MKKLLLVMALSLPLALSVQAQTAHIPNSEETRFLEFLDKIADLGDKWANAGYSRQADFFYGQAAAAVSSWRTALAEISDEVRAKGQQQAMDDAANYAMSREQEASEALSDMFGTSVNYGSLMNSLNGFLKSAENVEAKVEQAKDYVEEKAKEWGMDVFIEEEQEWYSARSQSIASPYPDYFRGMVCEYKGDAAGANKYYGRALKNPFFPGIVFDFSYLARLSYAQLVELSNWLKPYQVKFEAPITHKGFHFDYDVPSWDADALARTAGDFLSQDVPDYVKAQDFLEAAMHADPFKVKYVYLAAMLYTQLGDGVSAARCLNEALKMDPDNTDLKAAVATWNSQKEKK